MLLCFIIFSGKSNLHKVARLNACSSRRNLNKNDKVLRHTKITRYKEEIILQHGFFSRALYVSTLNFSV